MKNMCKNFLMLMFSVGLISNGLAQITTPRVASPAAKVSQTIGISKITVEYSRPAVRNREIWGNLVPYGWNVQGFGLGNSAPWRSGANENTVITFSHDVTFQGVEVPAGYYGLFFIINEDNSGEVILSKDTQSWGSFFYDESNDQMRASITIRDLDFSVERLTYDFVIQDKNTAELVLNWEKKQFPVKVEFAVDDLVMANAEQELKGTAGFNWLGWQSAANYALQNNVDLEKGLSYIDRALAQNNGFGTKRIKAGLLTALERESEAEDIMEEAVANANENELNTYGYQLLGQQKFEKAIEIFTLNTEKNPQSANVWDSLGEGLVLGGGSKEKAIKAFEKSLSLEPAANVRANSEKYLKQLEAL